MTPQPALPASFPTLVDRMSRRGAGLSGPGSAGPLATRRAAFAAVPAGIGHRGRAYRVFAIRRTCGRGRHVAGTALACADRGGTIGRASPTGSHGAALRATLSTALRASLGSTRRRTRSLLLGALASPSSTRHRTRRLLLGALPSPSSARHRTRGLLLASRTGPGTTLRRTRRLLLLRALARLRAALRPALRRTRGLLLLRGLGAETCRYN